MASSRKSVPKLVTKDSTLRRFGDGVKELLETGLGNKGNKLDKWLTLRDFQGDELYNLMVSALGSGSGNVTPGGGVGDGGSSEDDPTPPPAPTGVYALSGIGVIYIGFDFPWDAYGNHSHANIYKSTENNFANAVKLTQISGALYADPVSYQLDENEEVKGFYYWVTFTSTYPVEGPPHDVNGVYAAPVADPDYMIQLFTGKITSTQLHADLNSRIDLIDSDASTAGSVAWRVAQESAARAQSIADEAQARADALTQEANDRNAAIITAVAEEAAARGSAIAAEAGTRQSADEALAFDVAALQSTINNPTTGLAATASALTETHTLAEQNEQALSSQAGTIASIQSSINDLTISEFNASTNYAVDQLFRYNDVIYSVIATQSQPNATPPNATYYEAKPDYTSLADVVSANSGAIDALNTKTTQTDNKLATEAGKVAQLQSEITGKASTSALEELLTEVELIDDEVTAQASKITDLEAGRQAANLLPAEYADFSGLLTVPDIEFDPSVDLAPELSIVSANDSGAINGKTLRVTTYTDSTFIRFFRNGYWLHPHATEQGAEYFFSCEVILGSSNSPKTTNNLELASRHVDAAGNYLGYKNAILSLAAGAPNRIRVGYKIVPFTDSAFFHVGIQFRGFNNAGPVTYYINNVMLEKAKPGQTEPSAWTPGIVTAQALESINATLTETAEALTLEAGKITNLQTQIGDKADSSVLNNQISRIDDAEGNIQSLGQAVTGINTSLEDKVETSAFEFLSSEVEDIDGVVSGHASKITHLEASRQGVNLISPEWADVGQASALPDAQVSGSFTRYSYSATSTGVNGRINVARLAATATNAFLQMGGDDNEELIPVVPGQTYIFSVYVHQWSSGSPKSTSNFQTYFKRFSQDESYITYSGLTHSIPINNITRAAHVWTCPSDTYYVRLRVDNESFNSNGTTYQAYACFQLEQAKPGQTEPSAWVPGSFSAAVAQNMRVDLETLSASYTLKLDVNGRVAGYGAAIENGVSTFEIVANQFAVWDPDAEKLMIGSDANGVYIDGAYMKTASISSAAIDSLVVNKITGSSGQFSDFYANTLVVTTAMMQNAAITNAKIANAAITAAKIGDAEVGTLKIAGNAVTVSSFVRSSSSVVIGSNYTELTRITVDAEGGNLILQAATLIDMSKLDTETYQGVYIGLRDLATGATYRYEPFRVKEATFSRDYVGLTWYVGAFTGSRVFVLEGTKSETTSSNVVARFPEILSISVKR